MKNYFTPLCCIAMVLLVGSCTKEPLNNLSEDEGRIYVTKHDETANFGTFQTFSIADSVAVIEDNQFSGLALTSVDLAYVQAVKDQMQQRGYTLVARDANPDLAINVNRIYNSYTGIFSYNDYMNYYNGYWDPYYWGYPGYDFYFPSYYGFYEITEGALSIDFFDLMNAASGGDNNIKGIWNGLIRGTGTFREENAAGGVQTLFDQSTYIQIN